MHDSQPLFAPQDLLAQARKKRALELLGRRPLLPDAASVMDSRHPFWANAAYPVFERLRATFAMALRRSARFAGLRGPKGDKNSWSPGDIGSSIEAMRAENSTQPRSNSALAKRYSRRPNLVLMIRTKYYAATAAAANKTTPATR